MATPRLGLVVEDKPTELSCTICDTSTHALYIGKVSIKERGEFVKHYYNCLLTQNVSDCGPSSAAKCTIRLTMQN